SKDGTELTQNFPQLELLLMHIPVDSSECEAVLETFELRRKVYRDYQYHALQQGSLELNVTDWLKKSVLKRTETSGSSGKYKCRKPATTHVLIHTVSSTLRQIALIWL
ncbi:9947_t:CDS:2, partial [Funneliformis geosporum]